MNSSEHNWRVDKVIDQLAESIFNTTLSDDALAIIEAVLSGDYERGTVYTNDTDFWTVRTPRQPRVTEQDKIDALSDLAKNTARGPYPEHRKDGKGAKPCHGAG